MSDKMTKADWFAFTACVVFGILAGVIMAAALL